MAIDSAYETATNYKTAFSITASTQDARIASVLLAVSRYIERRLDRFFNIDASVVERLYLPTGRRLKIDGLPAMMVDDIASTTGLVVKQDTDNDGSVADETAWTLNSDYLLWPLNADKGPEAQPWRAIVLPAWTTVQFMDVRLSVTAKFGWPAVPSAIAQATIELAGIVMTDSPRATTRMQEGVESAIAMSPQAQSIILALVEEYRLPMAFS